MIPKHDTELDTTLSICIRHQTERGMIRATSKRARKDIAQVCPVKGMHRVDALVYTGLH